MEEEVNFIIIKIVSVASNTKSHNYCYFTHFIIMFMIIVSYFVVIIISLFTIAIFTTITYNLTTIIFKLKIK